MHVQVTSDVFDDIYALRAVTRRLDRSRFPPVGLGESLGQKPVAAAVAATSSLTGYVKMVRAGLVCFRKISGFRKKIAEHNYSSPSFMRMNLWFIPMILTSLLLGSVMPTAFLESS